MQIFILRPKQVITSSDSEYKATKLVKQGKAVLAPRFEELARWIAATWGVTILNVIHEGRNALRPPRLQVILEYQREAEIFRDGFNFDREKQSAIKTRFLAIIGREGASAYDVDGLFVVFSAFDRLAKEEADSRILDTELDALRLQIGDPGLWLISRCFGRVTFFFYTDAQAKHSENAGKKQEYAKRYFELLRPHNEFGYLDEQTYTVSFDSKQNLDENYEGSWFNYYR